MKPIYDEYAGIGFTEKFGGTLSLRSTEEQRAFIVHCRSFNLPVVSPVAITEEGMLFPFITGLALPHVLGFGDREMVTYSVRENLKDIQRAHAFGLVYGDRWGPNEIISPEGIRRIDMDLQIDGSYAREFELAQALYHMVYWTKDTAKKSAVLDVIASELNSINNQYDSHALRELLAGHMQYFINTEYECLDAYRLVDLFI